MRSFLRRLAGDVADDLAQEAFVRAWRAAASYRGDGSYEGWLLRIAWRLFLSERGETSRRAAASGEQGEDRLAADPNLRLDIDRAMARLPDRERAAALLCFGEGYSHGEASEILGMPLGTLKSVVARARAALLADLKGNQL